MTAYDIQWLKTGVKPTIERGAGSSSRAALPSCANSCTSGEARCHLCPGEPMWPKR